MLAPVLLFTYNRPRHTRQLVDSLRQNNLCSATPLFVYCDAPRAEKDKILVEETLEVVRSIEGFASVEIIKRTENYGLAKNIIDGVTTQINKYGRVIVLEDDLIVSPYFLQFMNDALELYKDEPGVGHINANNFIKKSSLPDTYYIKFTGSWGWATWDRAWRLFNIDGKSLLKELENRNLTHVFDFDRHYPFTRMLRRQVAGQNNSWAIRWNASLFLADVLSLNAGRSLVINNGFDGSGVNCGNNSKLYASTLYMRPIEVNKIDPVMENVQARKAYSDYYHRTNCFMAKAIRRIIRTLKCDFGR